MKKSKALKVMSTCLMTVALVIAVTLLLSIRAEAATVASGTCGANLTWTLDDEGTLTISGTGATLSTNLPWGYYRSSVKTVIIRKGVTAIGDMAFYNYYNLEYAEIPETVASIGDFAFAYCYALQTVKFAENITTIGEQAFSGCTSLESIVIPDSVTTLNESAFASCANLQTVTMGKNITTMKASVFSDCPSLSFNTYDNAKYLGNEDNPYLMLFACQSETITSCQIHEDTKIIYDKAFYNCDNLTSIDIPSGLIALGYQAFSACDSLVYNLYDNAKYLGNAENPYLVLIAGQSKEITECQIHNESKFIHSEAFYGGAMQSINIPDSITSIGDFAFYSCKSLTSVSIGNGVISVGNGAFGYCHYLSSVSIGDRVAEIGKEAFTYCKNLTVVTVPGSVTAIGDLAFSQSGLSFITIPNSVTIIGSSAFYATGLTAVTVPDSVNTISSHLFGGCRSLKEITIPASVIDIGNYAFDGCGSLTAVYYGGDEIQWDEIRVQDNNYWLSVATVYCDHIHDYTQPPATTVLPRCDTNGYIEYNCIFGETYREILMALGGSCDFSADPTTCGNCGYVRANVAINNVVLRPACGGLYFKGNFNFDKDLQVTRYGIAVSLYSKLPTADDTDPQSLYTIGENSVLISNILGEGKNGRDLIYARPYALLADGTYIYGDVVVINLKAVVEAIDLKLDTLTAAQQTAITDLYRQNTAVMQHWLIPKIKEFA